ncbi:32-trans-enoyl-CoA isomerase - mitochondrial precursor [Perkinsela sp. CCAP 1560/4]|nr:32-trans-enoyl-CoA isomerase - mitochondrial precursor [Perkinsela sp. CCAP 1560/4]|eukprot:KNH08879.1 32-trans-enoyl-CoA isomerase - mitochondrial precursor [Perkinsela sp. CCAP 1560/4]
MQTVVDENVNISYRDIHAGRIAILELYGNQQNLLNADFMLAIHRQLAKFYDDPAVTGIVLTSGWMHKFSSGPDIKALGRPASVQFRILYDAFSDLYIQTLRSPKPLVAAINGDCPSFACALVMACDERVMAWGPPLGAEKDDSFGSLSVAAHAKRYLSLGEAENSNVEPPVLTIHQHPTKTGVQPYTIGFPEPTISMTIPRWVIRQMAHLIGPKCAEFQLRYGHMWTAQQAHNIGLVDHLCSANTLMETALRRVQVHAQVRNDIWQVAKYSLRGNMALSTADFAQKHVSRAIFRNHFFRFSNEIQNRILRR